eukprot:scaffold2601_cov198-Pinguiococcus_pyrenoidosus.AAC.2
MVAAGGGASVGQQRGRLPYILNFKFQMNACTQGFFHETDQGPRHLFLDVGLRRVRAGPAHPRVLPERAHVEAVAGRAVFHAVLVGKP